MPGSQRDSLRRAVALIAVMACAQATAATHVLVVAGLGGEPQFEERFVEWAQRITAASATAASGSATVHKLSGAAATGGAIEKSMREITAGVRTGDQFVLVLLGHGSFDGSEYRLNIPGPDLTGSQLLVFLDRLPTSVPQLVVNATSASGAISDRWAKPHRSVVTATRVAGERNATRFGGYWAEALTSDESDRDKDGVVTALEAYEFASRKVADSFKADAAIATEHSRLAGSNPAVFIVARLGAAALFASDAELITMREQQNVIEGQLMQTRAQKAQLPADDYYERLEPVMIDLARLGQRIDARLAALGATNAGERK
jgi:hypothetical protein